VGLTAGVGLLLSHKAPRTRDNRIAARRRWLQVGNLLGAVSLIPVARGLTEREKAPG